MRTFSCFSFAGDQTVPDLTLIVASSLSRARELVRRELQSERGEIVVEICEGSELLCTETLPAAPRGGRRRRPFADAA
jgi:hypothetical protein